LRQMNEAFFKFWAEMFARAAGDPARMDALARLMAAGSQGLAAMGKAMDAFFTDKPAAIHGPGDAEAFAGFLKQFYDGFNVVPRGELENAQGRCRQLEEKLAAAERQIETLRVELGAARLAQGDGMAGLGELVKVQQHQFEKLTASIGRIFGPGRDNTAKR